MANNFSQEPIQIDPRVDYVCKMLIGHEQRTHITKHFLNATLKLAVPIKSVVIQNPINDKEFDDDKLSILDILATDEHGSIFNIEVQRFLKPWIAERLVYYLSTRFVSQLFEGDGYGLLRPVIGICILDAVMFGSELSYHNEFRLRTQSGHELSNSLQTNVLELPKYAPPSDNRSVEDPLDQWMHFFRFALGETPANLADKLPDPIFEDAVEVLQMIQRNPQDRYNYEMRLKAERDLFSSLEAARLEGKSEGRLEGKLENLQQLLGLPTFSESELANMGSAELERLISELQAKLRGRIITPE